MVTRCSSLAINSTERTNFLGYGLSSRKGKRRIALWVNPPPQGFSHARCSSKIFTVCPARASCSPHIAPDGPPPTIAISAISRLANFREVRFRARYPLAMALRGRGQTVKSPSKQRENHQAKSCQEYSTEDRRRCRRPSNFPDNIHAPPLRNADGRKIRRQQHQQNLSAMQHHNAEHQ